MGWQDRIKEAAYTSPSGIRITFQYENVSQEISKKTSSFDFPDADGTYIQDLGKTGRRYPLRLFFWGDDYDIEVVEFQELLLETGVGKLEHPVYGSVDVVPFGDITRRDDLVTRANEAVIQVTFWETIGLVYPVAADDPGSEALQAVEEYNELAAVELEENLELETTVKIINFKNQVLGLVDSVKSGLQTIADVQEAVQKQFNAITDSINESIDLLISTPLTLASQITQMIQAPARALSAIQDRLSAYGDLAQALISGDGANVSDVNNLRTRDLHVSSYVTGSIISVVNNQFVTKVEAIEAAEEIISQFDEVVAWRDTQFEALEASLVDLDAGAVDTGGAYEKLQEAVSLAAGYLVQISFNLKEERKIILDRPRTIIDLVCELYNNVDTELDFFITSNNLTGSEILELPAGREIVYYI